MILPWAWFGEAVLHRATYALLVLGTFRTVFWGLGLYVCPGADQALDRSPARRTRRGMAVFWGLVGAAVLLYAVLIVAKVWVTRRP